MRHRRNRVDRQIDAADALGASDLVICAPEVRAVQNAEITMTDCRVAADSSVDLGFMVTDRRIQDVDGNATASVLYASAIALGLAHSAWDRTVEYLTNRTNGGRPIASRAASM